MSDPSDPGASATQDDGSRRRAGWRSWLGWAAAAAGLVVFARVFGEYDVASVLARLPLAILLVLPLMGLRGVLGAWSWSLCFPRMEGSRPLPWRHLFWIRLAGEGINNGLVSAYVAGEPVKALLAARYGPSMTAALASSLIGKTLHTLGEVLFILLAAAVAAFALAATRPVAGWMFTAGAVGVAVLVVAVLLQRKRLLGRGARVLRTLRVGPRSLWDRAMPGADAVDAAVHAYYGHQRGDALLATLIGFLDWTFGAVEVWIFLVVATDAPHPFLLALVIEAGIDVVKGLSFFVPGSLGAQEGGIAWLFDSLGLGVANGAAYAVLRRLREVVWIALGLGALSWYMRRADAAAVVDPAGEAS